MKGLRILNTRPKRQALPLCKAIQNAGGLSVALPLLEIMPLSLDWVDHLPPLSSFQKAIFVSANAVDYFFQGLRMRGLSWPKHVFIITIGKGTAAALQAYGYTPHCLPNTPDSEHLLKMAALQQIQHQSILLISGVSGRPLITTTLKAKGAKLHITEVYKRTCPKKNMTFTHALWQDDGIDIILIFSQQALEHLFLLFEPGAKGWIQSKPCVVISPRLAQEAKKYQMQQVIYSSYDNLLTTIASLSHG